MTAIIPTYVAPSDYAANMAALLPPVQRQAPVASTYVSGTVYPTADVKTTSVILLFDEADRQDVVSRSSIQVLVHLLSTGVSLALLILAYATSLFSPSSVVASGPVISGLLLMVILSCASMLVEPYRYIVYGLIYLAAMVAFMAIGGALYDDAVFFGKVYMGIVVLLLLVSLIQWMQARQARWIRRFRLS